MTEIVWHKKTREKIRLVVKNGMTGKKNREMRENNGIGDSVVMDICIVHIHLEKLA